jgi:hypothetical protein
MQCDSVWYHRCWWSLFLVCICILKRGVAYLLLCTRWKRHIPKWAWVEGESGVSCWCTCLGRDWPGSWHPRSPSLHPTSLTQLYNDGWRGGHRLSSLRASCPLCHSRHHWTLSWLCLSRCVYTQVCLCAGRACAWWPTKPHLQLWPTPLTNLFVWNVLFSTSLDTYSFKGFSLFFYYSLHFRIVKTSKIWNNTHEVM